MSRTCSGSSSTASPTRADTEPTPQLDDVVSALPAAVDVATGHRFYLALNRFVAGYLLHIDHEERV